MTGYFIHTYSNDNLYGQEKFIYRTVEARGIIIPNETITVKISKKGYQKGRAKIIYGRYTYSVCFYLDPIKSVL